MLLGFASSAVRSVLRLFDGAEQALEKDPPLEDRLHEAISILHRTADSMEKHVEVLEGLASSLPALTDAVAKLSEQLGELLTLVAPLEAAEREVTGIGHLFHRRQHRTDAARGADPQA